MDREWFLPFDDQYYQMVFYQMRVGRSAASVIVSLAISQIVQRREGGRGALYSEFIIILVQTYI